MGAVEWTRGDIKSSRAPLATHTMTCFTVNLSSLSLLVVTATLTASSPMISQQTRIVGGSEVRPHSIPYQVSFQGPEGGHFCGGSVIDATTVLTAGQCCAPAFPGTRVVAALHDLRDDESDLQIRTVVELVSHPDFDLQTFAYDACLLRLDEPFQMGRKVQPVKLPGPGDTFAGRATASGWGVTETGATSNVLKAVTVSIVDDETCVANYEEFGLQVQPEVMMCAGDPGNDACAGDSGGPLVCLSDDVQCGIVSWARGCALPGFPGVYTEVAAIVDFVQQSVDVVDSQVQQ